MLPESVSNLYKDLRSVACRFKSPAFGSYFLGKVEDDFKDIKLKSCDGKDERAIERYLEEQGKLLDVLKRQTDIYNMFYDDSSWI
ncbi:ECU09_1695 [Encephalitozoon cuniculi GB-M1]|uniref:ECU09_1695 protein n=1 Tax=Encephalitozoon cuniculi (strain GB-M1) TaxID=284813 RepID=I7KFZ0_ENCCU|nr:uncharacterized protein ECU09_1695 [Encephalitozoon cuniculi GB-M1]KMV65350.1 hypothetical protein M970_091700 [Encephalitozoon cuniculi EcunIII-L]UYI26865.1 hypothetical protein J0A71_03g07030 [Encephalitozoon cuniculi]CCI73983.1 ECU09_1695 [Encephalitozoon cuniculi GB-M1]